MDNEEKLIRVYTGSEVLVNLLKEELEQVGVSAIIKNNFQSGIQAGIPSGVPSAIDLFIQKSDQKKAEQLIIDFKQTNA